VKTSYTLALVGNPNCGKTCLFNALTGSRQRVGNWPGVTVEKKVGEYHHADWRFEVVDLPGTYSLDVVDQEVSLDERVARDYIHDHPADLVINIIDASILERSLYLSSQLAEMRVPLLVALNMVDVAADKGLRVDAQALAQRLGCPVVPIVASEGQGLKDLKEAIHSAVINPHPATVEVRYDEALEQAIAGLAGSLVDIARSWGLAARWLAVRLLAGDDLARSRVGEPLGTIVESRALSFGEDLDILMADARFSLANRIASEVVSVTGRINRDLTQRIDRLVLNRILGIPIFLLMMYLMFMFTIHLGGAFIDFFEQFTGALLVDGFGAWLSGLGTPNWLVLLLAQGVGGGIQVVASFIPIIGCLFLFLSILEDSGYMARAAFVMDRFMRWIGLPGKSFVPLIVGFGCNVPAIMATRTLEHRRDRLMTIAMAPFMSCGARLPVYVLFATAFFPEGAQNVLFALYLIGIAVAVLTGLMLKNTLLQGEATPFIMELPPYHLPTLRGIWMHTWDRLRGFIFRAGQVIVPMVLILNVLNTVGTNGHEDSDRSVLATVGRSIAPLFSPLGLSEDNWPAAVGIFTGVLAKEAVVGTLNAAYSKMADQTKNDPENQEFNLRESLMAAFATIPTNLSEALHSWLDPLGLNFGDARDQAAVAEQAEVSTGIFGAMASRFDGTAGAFSYLLFILLYLPCTAALATVYQESHLRWAMFVSLWSTGLGFGVATLYYQTATFSRHPTESLTWIMVILTGLTCVIAWLRYLGQREKVCLVREENYDSCRD
jgi:ferrous iron transport protein B